MMGVDAILFIGPSLPERESGEPPGFERRPPAAQGDVYRATLEKPRAIGIVDGYFHGVPAVWHKEILWAMTKGIHVFGAASMGALRAAELHPFGMRGVGRIFEAYRDGALSDDRHLLHCQQLSHQNSYRPPARASSSSIRKTGDKRNRATRANVTGSGQFFILIPLPG